MAYVITSPCIDTQDQSCVEVCPVDCIHFDELEDRMLFINPQECIDCGACESACPVSAIFAQDDVPSERSEFVQMNGGWYSDKESVRARVNEMKPAPA